MATIVSAGFETDTDHHVDWFSSTTARTTSDAHTGTGSLSVTVGATFTGVQLDNFPYYSGVTPGSSYDFSIWAKRASGSGAAIQWKIQWYDNTGTLISTDTVTVTLTGSWARTATALTAPAGTTTLGWVFDTNGAGVVSDVLLFDDLLVADAIVAAARPPIVAPALAAIQAGSW